MESNPTLVGEIRNAWLEIIQEPDNDWILDTCTASMRLALAHGYGLLSVLRAKEQTTPVVISFPHGAPPQERERERPKPKTVPAMAPRRPTTKLRDALLQRQASREDDTLKGIVYPGAGGG